MAVLRAIRAWFSRLLDRIEWLLPDWLLLTSKAKIRRIVVLETMQHRAKRRAGGGDLSGPIDLISSGESAAPPEASTAF